MTIYEGIFPIALTTFDEHGEVDETSQLSLINYLIDCGVHGIAIFGNASEGYALSESEKARLMPLIIKEVRRRVPVFVSTGHTGTYVASQLSKAAEAVRACQSSLDAYDTPGATQAITRFFGNQDEKEYPLNKRLLNVGLIVLIDMLGFALIVPLLTFFADSFGATEFQTGLLVSSYALMQMIGAPILGRLSD